MNELDDEVKWFEKKCIAYDKLFQRELLTESEFVEGIIGNLFRVHNHDLWKECFGFVPKPILLRCIEKMEEIKKGGFRWIGAVFSAIGFDSAGFKQFTSELYPVLLEYSHESEL